MRLLLLFASLITSYALMIHAIFRAYRCRRCEVCKWCRDDVREAGEAVREERRGGRGQFRTRRKLIKHRFELHVCVSMPSWCMGPSLACTPSSPGIFLGGQSSGPAGSNPGSFRPPMGISHPAVVLFYHKTARFVLSLFTRGGQVRTVDRWCSCVERDSICALCSFGELPFVA